MTISRRYYYAIILTVLSLLFTLLIAIVAPLQVTADVSGAYWHGTVRIYNSGTATSSVSTNFTLSTQGLVNNNFMNSYSDASILYNGSPVPFMPGYSTYPWCVFVSTIGAGQNLNYDLYTGNVTGGKIVYFPGAIGMSVNDAASLELSSNFTVAFTDTWLDTSANQTYFNKPGAILGGTSDTVAGTLLARIWNSEALNTSYEVGQDAVSNIYSTYWGAQTFTAAADFLVTRCEVYTQRNGTVGTVTLAIRDSLTGSDIVSGTAAGDGWGAGFAYNSVTLSTPTLLYSGKTYGIILRAPSATGGANYINWGYDSTAPGYAGGNWGYSTNSGTSWMTGTNNDFLFKLYGHTVSKSVSAAGITSGEHDLTIDMESPFVSLGIDTSGSDFTPIINNLAMNAPLWQTECSPSPFTSIDSNTLSITVNGATWTDQGYSFDGINDYLSTPHNAAINFTNSFSFDVWVKLDTLGNYTILDKSGTYYWLHTDAAGHVIAQYYNGSDQIATTTSTLSTGTWYNLIATWDGATLSIYINSVLARAETKGGTISANAGLLSIGNRQAFTDQYFDGIIGELRLYNDCLTPTEVTRNYNATKSKYTSGNIYTSSTSATVPDNANNYQFGSSATPYITQVSVTVGGVSKGSWNWEYGATFTDDSGNGNTATPSFRTTSSDADVSAILISLDPVTESQFTTSGAGGSSGIVLGAPTAPIKLYTDEDYSKIPGADVANALIDASGITPTDRLPREMWWFPFIFGIIGVAGLCLYGVTTHEGSPGSLWPSIIFIEVAYILAGLLNPIGFFGAILFLIPAITCLTADKHYSMG